MLVQFGGPKLSPSLGWGTRTFVGRAVNAMPAICVACDVWDSRSRGKGILKNAFFRSVHTALHSAAASDFRTKMRSAAGSRSTHAEAARLSDEGVMMKQAGRRLEAFARYRAALELEPTYVNAYNNLAVALQQFGDVGGACRAYAHALRIEPSALPEAVPLNFMRAMLDGARWAHVPLLEWRARQPPRPGSPSPWSRLEARAFLVDKVSLLHASASMEADAVAHTSGQRWPTCGRD